MKYVDEFRNESYVKKISDIISQFMIGEREITLMEVCGTHTMNIFRFGLKNLLPSNIKLLSGPGCPVCVTPNNVIDKAIHFLKRKDVILTTFGDMVKVPGSFSSLEKQATNRLKIVYSVSDAVRIAKDNPEFNIVFLAIGFETTAPSIALSILNAERKGIRNFFILCANRLIPSALKVLSENKRLNVDGFILPGHVSCVIGSLPYQFIPQKYNIPCVISGFEPTDIMQSIYMLVKQIKQRLSFVEIQYKRAVTHQGNIKAKRVLQEVFKRVDSEWRGLGIIPKSGLKLKREFNKFDAEERFNIKIEKSENHHPDCICGEVLAGFKDPPKCKLFKKKCTPENPYGPCMVSSEGTCSAWYKYQLSEIKN